MNIPDEQHPAKTMPIPKINAPKTKGILIAETPCILYVLPYKNLNAEVPTDANKIPINMERNWSVEFMMKGSLVADTKQRCERCKIHPKPNPNIQYQSRS